MSRVIRRALVVALTSLPAACVAPPSSPVAPPPVAAPLAPEQRTVAQEIAADPGLSIYAGLLAAAGPDRPAVPAPFTMFVPDDEAFGRLPGGVAADLATPTNRPMLLKLLAYHSVAGSMTAEELRRRVTAGGGSVVLPTLAGAPLMVTLTGTVPTLTDADGDQAFVEDEAVRTDGVLQVVNGVLAPPLD